MRAAAIFGPGCSVSSLKPFQAEPGVEWSIGLPGSPQNVEVILIIGGDGTLHRHLGQLVQLELPLLVVPAGSGNDFARALGLRTQGDSLGAWKNFCRGAKNIRQIDLGLITPRENAGSSPAPRYFACVAGVGLDAEVARRANKTPRWLRANGGYAITLIPMIFRFAPFGMKILVPGNRHSIPAVAETASHSSHAAPDPAWTVQSDQTTLLAAFANTPLYGGGMKIAPLARMDDGLLDICVVGAINPLRLLYLFPTVYSGRHLKIREVEYSQATRVRVETERPLDIYADGEFVCQTPVEIGVRRAALTVIAP